MYHLLSCHLTNFFIHRTVLLAFRTVTTPNLMNSEFLESAYTLLESGRILDAAHEFHMLAERANSPSDRALALVNEHKCYCKIGEMDKARNLMRQIRHLPVQDKFVQMAVDFGDACMTVQMGKEKEGVAKFERLLQSNPELLALPDLRDWYEDIQQRRAFSLAKLRQYDDALQILREASSFTTMNAEDQQMVQFYLGFCYAAIGKSDLAVEAYRRAIDIGLGNEIEVDVRYRLAIVHFLNGAFARAKHQLEAALQMPEQVLRPELRKNLYEQMSRTCHYLGESQDEQRYLALARRL
jgi:tetratricopeptide (TPR) repeat protein